jgi:hypothetical protein
MISGSLSNNLISIFTPPFCLLVLPLGIISHDGA